jgi:hypothetical protein
MITSDYTYLFSILIFGLAWPLFYFLRKDLRKKIITISLAGLIAGPVSQAWYLKDYWHPRYTLGEFGILEDLLFSFLIFGFSATVINIITRTKLVKIPNFKGSFFRSLIPLAILLGSLFIFTDLLGINSIYSSAIGFVILAVFLWSQRRDLIKYSLIEAIFWLFLTVIAYNILLLIWPNFINEWWLWENISGIKIARVPLEEYLWFGAWGLVGSVIYEWLRGYKFERLKIHAEEENISNK